MSDSLEKQIKLVKKLYHTDKKSMQEIADNLGVSLNAVVYFMRKHKIPRREFGEANKLTAQKIPPSFSIRKGRSNKDKEVDIAGAMLYLGEGYKTSKSNGIDLANSDPRIVKIFMNFLRSRYDLDEKRFRAYVYCYEDQKVKNAERYWSKITGIPLSQFTKPYIRGDFKAGGRKMERGLVHVRYYDRRLLNDILNLIESYTSSFDG